jgi:hypothetical protein
MDTQTLNFCLARLNKLTGSRHLVGCYAADRLPKNFKLPLAVICHSHTSEFSIGHWTAVYASGLTPTEYFCSYGMAPHSKNHINFLNRCGRSFVHNDKVLQAIDTKVCGGWCLIYLANRMGYIKNVAKYLNDFKDENIKTLDQLVEAATVGLVNTLERGCT